MLFDFLKMHMHLTAVHKATGAATTCLALGIFLGMSTGCASEAPPACEGEEQAVTSDGRVRITSRAPVDVTAAGKLNGEPSEGPRAMKAVLLIDYSGSMYAGYAAKKVENCERCQADEKRRKKQPYYFGDAEFQSLVGDWMRAAAPPGTDLDVSVLLFNKALFDVVPGRSKADGGVVRKIANLDKVDLDTGTEPGKTPARILSYPVKLSDHTGDVERVLKAIPANPIRFDRKAAQETHLAAAVASARRILGDDGVIWLMTDNISDEPGTGTSTADALRNMEFYKLLKEDPRLHSVFAYPMFDTQQCTFLCGTSLFFYGIHVSSRTRSSAVEVNRMSGNHLRVGPPAESGVLWNPALKRLARGHSGKSKEIHERTPDVPDMGGIPLRLKPVDLDVVSVSFEKNKRGRVAPLKCKKSAEFGDKIPCVATLVVRNNMRHQSVKSGTLIIENDILLPRAASNKKGNVTRLKWAGAVCKNQVLMRELGRKSPQETLDEGKGTIEIPLRQLRPGTTKKIRLLVMVPSVAIAPTTIGEVFDTAFVDTVLLDGTIHARVENVSTQLHMPRAFRTGVYGSSGLPIIFKSRSQSEVKVDFPAVVPVNNDGKLRAILLFVGIFILALLILLILARFQRVRVTVYIDGVEHAKLSLPRVSRRKVERGATEVGSARRGLAGRVRFVPKKGISAKKSGAAWVLSGGGLGDCRVELRNGWGGSSRSSSRGGGSSF